VHERERKARNKIKNLKLHFARRIHTIELEEDRTKERKREEREMADSTNDGNSRLAVLREFNPRNKRKKEEEGKKKERRNRRYTASDKSGIERYLREREINKCQKPVFCDAMIAA